MAVHIRRDVKKGSSLRIFQRGQQSGPERTRLLGRCGIAQRIERQQANTQEKLKLLQRKGSMLSKVSCLSALLDLPTAGCTNKPALPRGTRQQKRQSSFHICLGAWRPTWPLISNLSPPEGLTWQPAEPWQLSGVFALPVRSSPRVERVKVPLSSDFDGASNSP